MRGGRTSHNQTEQMKIGRNGPCPCQSGKKYKKCCAKEDNALKLPASTYLGDWFDHFNVQTVKECKRLNRVWNDAYKNPKEAVEQYPNSILRSIIAKYPTKGFTRWTKEAFELYTKEGLNVATKEEWADLFHMMYVNGDDNKDEYDLREVIRSGSKSFMTYLSTHNTEELGDKIKVYRGVCLDKGEELGDDLGVSWALNKVTAEWFAKRWKDVVDCESYLIEGYVDKKDILMFVGEDDESEVCLWNNPSDVKITKIHGKQTTGSTGEPIGVEENKMALIG